MGLCRDPHLRIGLGFGFRIQARLQLLALLLRLFALQEVAFQLFLHLVQLCKQQLAFLACFGAGLGLRVELRLQ